MLIESVGSRYNILIDPLPQEVVIGTEKYSVDYTYRAMILISANLEERLVDAAQRIANALGIFYKSSVPQNIEQALDELWIFYMCGNRSHQQTTRNKADTKPLFSYHQDAAFIFAAFMGQYGINLIEQKNMHWWEFKALFAALSEDTAFKKIIALRAMDIDTKLPIKTQYEIREAQEAYALQESKSIEDTMCELLNQYEFEEKLQKFERIAQLTLEI